MFNIVITLLVWYLISKAVETHHYNSIRKRENLYKSLPVLTSYKIFPISKYKDATLVYAEYSAANDYFKKSVVSFLSFFGLNIVTYEKLLDRARREAILRLKEKCKNYDAIINLKLETVEINSSNNTVNKRIKGLQVLVSATAVNFAN